MYMIKARFIISGSKNHNVAQNTYFSGLLVQNVSRKPYIRVQTKHVSVNTDISVVTDMTSLLCWIGEGVIKLFMLPIYKV